MFGCEGAPVGAAEQQQRFGEVDRSSIDRVQAVDEFAVVAVRFFAELLREVSG